MSRTTLEDLLQKIHPNRFLRNHNQGDAHHIFTLYTDPSSQQYHYLATIALPPQTIISQGIAQNTSKKYKHLLLPIKVLGCDRTFSEISCLIRGQENVMLVEVYLSIKRDCNQNLEAVFIRKLIKFLVQGYKIIVENDLPLFGLGQMGIQDNGQFILCDPSLYFTQHRQHHTYRACFGVWVQKIMKDVLDLPFNQAKHAQIIRNKLGQSNRALHPLLLYIVSGQARIQEIQIKMTPVKSKILQDNSTITASLLDQNDMALGISQLSFKIHKQTAFAKLNNTNKIIVIFLVLAVLSLVAFGLFSYIFRNHKCQQGYFLDPSNQCQLCSDGCTRCIDSQPNTCMKCAINMYLVVNRQSDTHGLCLKECQGYFIRVDVCVRQHLGKQYVQNKQYIQNKLNMIQE